MNVRYTPEFKRNLRTLAKKYKQIRSDIQPLIEKLQDGKIVGDQIKGVHITIFKIRIQNSDIQKGKRSGYRVIYQLQNPNNIILITIYSKLDQGDIYAEQIRRILKEYSAI